MKYLNAIFCRLIPVLFLLIPSFSHAQDGVFISGALVNNSNLNLIQSLNGYYSNGYQYLTFHYVSGYYPTIKDLTVAKNEKGRFFFISSIGESSVIDLTLTTISSPMKYETLCRLTIKAVDEKHASISVDSFSNPYLSCQYQGNPMDNTATITVNGSVLGGEHSV